MGLTELNLAYIELERTVKAEQDMTSAFRNYENLYLAESGKLKEEEQFFYKIQWARYGNLFHLKRKYGGNQHEKENYKTG